ncbi:hypothetical protein CRG98_020475 [Punica granatum]|uniref:Uncharacterized protein n=1 Tax=Punica granatum TaxID=22663 RepID=A0A2I0JS21_PUNGR|nr:hypothetical protein CRG98_020475 [Punica granatum]
MNMILPFNRRILKNSDIEEQKRIPGMVVQLRRLIPNEGAIWLLRIRWISRHDFQFALRVRPSRRRQKLRRKRTETEVASVHVAGELGVGLNSPGKRPTNGHIFGPVSQRLEAMGF